MNETLKGVAHIGAELAAAKADLQREMERHRKTWRQLEQVTALLREIEDEVLLDNSTVARIQIALSQQAEPAPIVDALSFVQPVPDHCDRIVWRERYYHLPLVEKAEPAPAQDEREAFKRALHSQKVFKLSSATIDAAEWAWFSRPAQTEQQPEQSGLVEAERDQLRAEVEGLRKDAERWRYVSLQGDDTHWLNLLRVDLDDFGGNINAAVDALIDGEAPAMDAKEE